VYTRPREPRKPANPARASTIHAARYANATLGQRDVQSTPATPLAARLPKLCIAASNPILLTAATGYTLIYLAAGAEEDLEDK
jgi:hypothetical protein